MPVLLGKLWRREPQAERGQQDSVLIQSHLPAGGKIYFFFSTLKD